MKIERETPDGHPMATAYVEAHERVAGFYLAGSPREIDSYRRVADRTRAVYPAERWSDLVKACRPSDDRAAARLAELAERRGLFVATGQQAGLFTGPLLTLYKALTAARLAADLSEHLELPVMPLFWIAAEDHDWPEVNHTYVVDLENRLRRIEVARPETADDDTTQPPVGRIRFGTDLEPALDELLQATPDTEFKADLVAPLREAYRPGRGVADAFESALLDLLRGFGFAVVQASDDFVKIGTRGLLRDEWQRRVEVEEALRRNAQRIESAGFTIQVPILDNATNLFVDGRLGRDRLLYDSEGGRLRRSGEPLSDEAVDRLIEESPERVSPGVLMRPVAEARAFPVVAYVTGPSETAYLAQSQELFQLHDVPAPVVVPRASLRIVESKIEKVLHKYELDPGELAGDTSTAVKRIMDRRTPRALIASLENLRTVIADAMERVESTALEADPGAGSALGAGAQAIFGAVDSLEETLRSRIREQDRVVQQQLEKAAVHLFPEGVPQERQLNVYPYLFRYGRSLLSRIHESCTAPLG